jgi:hypothetical protein
MSDVDLTVTELVEGPRRKAGAPERGPDDSGVVGVVEARGSREKEVIVVCDSEEEEEEEEEGARVGEKRKRSDTEELERLEDGMDKAAVVAAVRRGPVCRLDRMSV